jgi:hypothetical protein
VLATGGLLSIVTGQTGAGAKASPGATTRVSVDDAGNQQERLPQFFYNGAVNPSVSGDRFPGDRGQQVAFDTEFPLDPLDAGNDAGPGTDGQQPRHESDVYVRDRARNHTVLITRGRPPVINLQYATAAFTGEAAANGQSTDPSVSADGRYVAFVTTANNLAAANQQFPGPDPTHAEIVVCDRDPDGNGVLDEHVVKTDPNSALDYKYTVVSDQHVLQAQTPSSPPSGSPPSNSPPSNSPPGGGGTSDGVPSKRINDTAEPSLTVNRATGTGTVAYVTQDDSISSAPRPPAEVFVAAFRLTANGQLDSSTLEQVNASRSAANLLPGVQRDGAGAPALSRDGTHVAFGISYHSLSTAGIFSYGAAILDVRLVEDDGFRAVDLARLDVDAAGKPLSGYSGPPSITGTGRKVAFAHTPDGGPATQAVVVDRDPDGDGTFWPAPGELPDVTIASRNNLGQEGNGDQPALSVDGRYVAFVTSAANMHNGVDDNSGSGPCSFNDFAPPSTEGVNCSDVVVRDLVVDAAREKAGQSRLLGELASPGARRDCVPALPPGETCEGDGISARPVLSDDGSQVAYESEADDLLPGGADSNRVRDVFVREFQPRVAADPVGFGTVDVGSTAEQTATVRHVGFGPLQVDSVALSGPNAAEFTVLANTCTTTVLHETEVCRVSLRFTPTVPGKRTATLTVTPHVGARLPIPVTAGVGVPPDGFRASPNPMGFGQRLPLSPSGPATLTVSNSGRLPFTVFSVTRPAGGALFPDDYAVSQDTCTGQTVPVGGSCTLKVTFTPHATGTRNGALQVTTVQTGTSSPIPHLIALTGSSAAQAAQVNPGVVTAGRVGVLTGQGFPPNHAVSLTISDFGALPPVQTAADGSFSQSLVVFLHTTQGSRTVEATVPGTTLKATATVLVVPGTFQPPDFVSRR